MKTTDHREPRLVWYMIGLIEFWLGYILLITTLSMVVAAFWFDLLSLTLLGLAAASLFVGHGLVTENRPNS